MWPRNWLRSARRGTRNSNELFRDTRRICPQAPATLVPSAPAAEITVIQLPDPKATPNDTAFAKISMIELIFFTFACNRAIAAVADSVEAEIVLNALSESANAS